jgi:NADH-quinone oxidoreductase subunit C
MILETIKAEFSVDVVKAYQFRCDLVVVVDKDIIVELMKFLKDDEHCDFNMLMDLSAIDYSDQDRNPRFDVVYHLYSLRKKHRLRVKVHVEEKDLTVDSITSVWPAADWFEREVWDMFGIKFNGHPNLKRILMYEGFEGHPLRKDFPINYRQPLIAQKSDEELEARPEFLGQTPFSPENMEKGV